MYARLKSKGLNLVAVNSGDTAKVINDYYKQGKFTFPSVMDVQNKNSVADKYGVQAYPTNYVIKANGTIAARFVGFDEDAMKKALAKLGLK